jgi:hypothetical protein
VTRQQCSDIGLARIIRSYPPESCHWSKIQGGCFRTVNALRGARRAPVS